MPEQHFEIIGRCQFTRSCQAASYFSDRAKIQIKTDYAHLAARYYDELASEARKRRCPACHRPIALKHFQIYTWDDQDPEQSTTISREDLAAMVRTANPTV